MKTTNYNFSLDTCVLLKAIVFKNVEILRPGRTKNAIFDTKKVINSIHVNSTVCSAQLDELQHVLQKYILILTLQVRQNELCP